MSTLFIYNALLNATQIPIQIHNSNCVKHRGTERERECGIQAGSGSRLKLISFETLLLFQAETQYTEQRRGLKGELRASKRRRRSSVRSQKLNDTKQSKTDQQNDQQTLLLVNGAEPKSPEESAPNITTTTRAVTIVNSHKMKIYRVRSVARWGEKG